MALSIIGEEVLLGLPRKNGDHLRVVFTKAKTEEGQVVAWHALELGKVSEAGEFVERHKVVIRGRELLAVLETLHKAYFGSPPPGAELSLELEAELDSHELLF
jgi:hypothetical protein